MSERDAVLITGSASGIGRETALEFARRGHRVVATDFEPDRLEDLPVDVKLALDVTSPQSIAQVVAAIGPISVLVNNAGVSLWGPIECVPLAEARRIFETHFFGPLQLIHAVLPDMRERGSGTIVNVTSSAARAPMPVAATYAASRAALDVTSEMLAFEVHRQGVRVLVVEPGATRTGMAERRKIYGLEDPTYDWLVEKHMALYDALQADGGNPPSVVAKVIADAVEDGSRRLRYPGAADAKRMTDAHRQNDDVAYLDHMAAELGLDW